MTEPSRLSHEQPSCVIVSGVRYTANSRSNKVVLTRTLVTGNIGGVIIAVIPLVVGDPLGVSARLWSWRDHRGALHRRSSSSSPMRTPSSV
ncbi:MFS transporter [Bradyrhizobium sp. WSM 1738]|nr:MFS transporter [Bradyrhizobium hereditatis]